jgi:glucose-6-phosphate isomerase
MKYLRRTSRCIVFDHKRNEEILEEFYTTPLEEGLCAYRHNWFQQVHRMEDYRPYKQLLNCHPKEDDDLDDVNAKRETGHPGLHS